MHERLCHESVNAALETLSPEKATVLRLRLGLDRKYRRRTHAEVSVILDLPRERVHAIEVTALAALKHFTRGEYHRYLLCMFSGYEHSGECVAVSQL